MLPVYVRFNRLSVGRNVYGPDEMVMQAEDDATLNDVMMTIWNTRFLPDVRAFRVAWVALHEGRALAVVGRGLRAPVLFTNGKAPVADYARNGAALFFMSDLGRKESRAVLSSLARKVGEGDDSTEAMNDVLESYLLINQKFNSGMRVALNARGGEEPCGGFMLHGSARLSDAVYSLYRSGCLEALRGGPVWILSGSAGALAVLSKDWSGQARAQFIAEQDTQLNKLFNEEEHVQLMLFSAGHSDPEEVYAKLKGQKNEDKPQQDIFGDGINDRFKRL